MNGIANFRISSKNTFNMMYPDNVIYFNQKFIDVMNEQMGKGDFFNSYIYSSFGAKIGRCPRFNLEFHFPLLNIKRISSWSKQVGSGYGISLNMQIPIKK